MGRVIFRLANGVLLAAVLTLLISNMGPSAVKEMWIYSYFRFAMLTAVAGVAAYLLVSFWRPRLLMWNAAALGAATAALAAGELGLRMFPGAVPDHFLTLFPAPVQSQIAASRGMFSSSTLRGDRMIYAYVPGWKNPRQPWLKIDSDGYRNPARPAGKADVVLLGDSITIAQSAKKDLGDHFRDAGLTAANYGFAGYGVLHYRDVYRAMVLKRNLSHRWVVVLIAPQNDFTDSRHYLEVQESGGNWKDYLDRPSSLGWPGWADGSFTPWSVSAAVKLPFVLRQRSITSKKNVPLVMPRGTVAAGSGILWFPDFAPGSPERRATEKGLRALVEDASRAGAKVVLAMAPNAGLIYGRFAKGHEARFEIIEKSRRRFVTWLSDRFAGNGVMVVDLTDALAGRAGVEVVTAHELDYHLNDRGVEIVFHELMSRL